MLLTGQPASSRRRVLVCAIVVGCLIFLAIIGVGVALFRHNYLGPEFEGRKLADWVNDLSFPEAGPSEAPRSKLDNDKHEAALKAVASIGTNALPLALRLCRVENSTFELKLMNWCDDFNQQQKRLHLDPEVTPAQIEWQRGLNIFRTLGPNAAPAIATLIDYLGNPDSAAAQNATAAFRYIGPESIPPLQVALTNSNPNIALLAIFSLSRFDADARSATPLLEKYIQSGNAELADVAAYTFAKINDDPVVIVPVLREYLKRPASHPRSEVFSKLGSCGTNAISAVPALVAIIESNQQLGLIPRAMAALAQIDPDKANYLRAQREAHLKTNLPPKASYNGLTPAPAN